MNKKEFLSVLSEKLNVLPEQEIDKSVIYFSEIIDDRIEDGMTEEQAVESLETVEKIVEKIMLDMPLSVLVKSKIKSKKPLSVIGTILIIMGSPVWLPLLLAGLILIFAFYITVWAMIISLYAVIVSFAVSGVVGIVTSVFYFYPTFSGGLMLLGVGLICTGLSILLFFPSKKVSLLLIKLTTIFFGKIKSRFIVKEVA